jgi:hypothetical protein
MLGNEAFAAMRARVPQASSDDAEARRALPAGLERVIRLLR